MSRRCHSPGIATATRYGLIRLSEDQSGPLVDTIPIAGLRTVRSGSVRTIGGGANFDISRYRLPSSGVYSIAVFFEVSGYVDGDGVGEASIISEPDGRVVSSIEISGTKQRVESRRLDTPEVPLELSYWVDIVSGTASFVAVNARLVVIRTKS